ncbi:type IX secretion system membrane protein PorP/SprF [Sphingobacterium psychroaquaticum]|uniref:PorP/SprF family type IX secretion system membrane protein n=1 Tax=Sphingobacterium psychroaquaticum TaxID=561061 RepID=UPI00106C5451|nr:PorP/SprF family type IX secretion system membrane protein [Sphingobacterium psychroaquaticum]QBQ42008.1 type IX secretion system membrane protein PorP/SprF [Sphingobacterium psychroaquaticum]
MKTLKIIMGAMLLSLPFIGRAQHGISYNQFGQLRNSFNSSLSTMDDRGSFSVLGRSQWVGVDGAPKSIWATGNAVIKPIGLSVGGDVKHSELGIVKESEFSVFAAKAVRLSEDEYLSLSMGGGLLYFQGNYNHLDPNDPAFRDNIRETNGILSISTSYYRKDRYYVGVSMPRFSLKRDANREYEFRNVYYITGGALFRLDDAFHIRPSFIVSHMDDLTPRYDVSALVFMARKIGVGMGVQNQGDLSGLLQFNFGNFGIGYSYQFSPKSPTMNQRISNNTHEVGLRYRVGGIGLL